MKRLFRRVQHLNTLRKLFGWSTLAEALQKRLELKLFDEPPSGKVLVLAPHPGDDVIALGGTIAKHRARGDEVRIIYLCDGRLGTARRTTDLVQQELKKTRRAEAVRATDILGVPPGSLSFWAYRDRELAANKTTTKVLTQLLTDYVPDIIYAPHPFDNEPDHMVTAEILHAALRAIGSDLPAELWNYELWQPTFANRLITVGNVMRQKLAAIEAHESQIKFRPYPRAAEALNTYRGELAGAREPAEAFLTLSPSLYLKIWNLLKGLE